MENSNNENNIDFNFPLPIDDEDNLDDLEYNKILEKEIESTCIFNKYIDKLEIKNDFTDEELITNKTKEEIISYKNDQIIKLKAYIASLEQEKEDLINNFKNTTNALLDKIKDLEQKIKKENISNTINNVNNNDIYIERPGTAMIIQELKENEINNKDVTKTQRCPNCKKDILESEFIAHSLTCLRHNFKCKKCGELINDNSVDSHIKSWLSPERIYKSINENNFEEFILILEHGLKDDNIIDEKEGDNIYHSICRNNKFKFLKELNKRNIKFNLDLLNNNKETPLTLAINSQSIECAEIIIKMGANISIRNKADLSPLMLSAKYGFSKLCDILIKNGADINEKNILGETPLSLAQIYHHDDLAMKILQLRQVKFK